MRSLSVFESISVDGYFTDADNEVDWAYAGGEDPEFAAFTASNAKGGGALVFGRETYDMMAGWWPSPMAAEAMPEVAAQMNALPKIVFSRSLETAEWQNTTVIRGDAVAEMRRLKSEDGGGMVILGSGSIVAQMAKAGLVDDYQLVVCPVVLGSGRTVFDGVDMTRLKLGDSRTFKNGKVFLHYKA